MTHKVGFIEIAVEHDSECGATYYELVSGAEVARTVEISDGVMVDLDKHGYPVGVEVLFPYRP